VRGRAPTYNATVVTLAEFKATLSAPAPPSGLSPALAALWHDARGDWDAAHGVAQAIESPDGAWIHAYLHRKEGDAANAAYWYRRAGQPVASGTLEAEWAAIAAALLPSPSSA
jgi:hypothetical protein